VLAKWAKVRVRSEKEQAREGRFYFTKEQGLKQNKTDCFVNPFELAWIAG
jgi:hypothetical protein